jgi:hypothetical protein
MHTAGVALAILLAVALAAILLADTRIGQAAMPLTLDAATPLSALSPADVVSLSNYLVGCAPFGSAGCVSWSSGEHAMPPLLAKNTHLPWA